MKYLFFAMVLFFSVNGVTQETKVAFINKDKILDTLTNLQMDKWKAEYEQELKLMNEIYAKRVKECKYAVGDEGKTCGSDTVEYKMRIDERRKQIEDDLFNKKTDARENNEAILKKEMDKFSRKKGYKEWKDISKGMPLDYSKEHDYTEYMTLVLQ